MKRKVVCLIFHDLLQFNFMYPFCWSRQFVHCHLECTIGIHVCCACFYTCIYYSLLKKKIYMLFIFSDSVFFYLYHYFLLKYCQWSPDLLALGTSFMKDSFSQRGGANGFGMTQVYNSYYALLSPVFYFLSS